MPRNGSGVYNAPANTKGVPNTTIESSRYNAFIDDLESVLTGSVAADGQTPMTGALAMGGSKITGLADGTAATDAVTKTQMDAAISAAIAAAPPEIPSGSNMLFVQTSAPTGWTLNASLNDRVLRVSSTVGAGVGGSWTISGLTVQNHTLTTSQMPSHTHDNLHPSTFGSNTAGLTSTASNIGPTRQTGAKGSSGAHAHSLSANGAWRPAYVDAIICIKD